MKQLEFLALNMPYRACHLIPLILICLFSGVGLADDPAPLEIISPASLLDGATSDAHGPVTFGATGGSGLGYSWSAAGLPAGLSMSAAGTPSGTPGSSTADSHSVMVSVQDSHNRTDSATLALSIEAVEPLTITTASLPSGYTLTAYPAVFLSASGGEPPYTWSATGLPGGLRIQSGLSMGGVPNNIPGTYQVELRVVDSSGETASTTLPLLIEPSELIAPPHLLPAAKVGLVYGPFLLPAWGGVPPYTWSGSGLPSGITLSAAGSLGGVPAAGSSGEHHMTFQVTDSEGATASTTMNLIVAAADAPLEIISPTSLADAVVGEIYPSVHCSAIGGSTSGYTWSASGLPEGFSMLSIGLLSGAARAGQEGLHTVEVTVQDSEGATATLPLPLRVHSYPHLNEALSPPGGKVGEPYGPITLSVEGGTPPYVFSSISGVPEGMSLSAGGVLSGTPAPGTEGSHSIHLTITDAFGYSSQDIFHGPYLQADLNPLRITGPSGLVFGSELADYGPVQFGATEGEGGRQWSATDLPAGLTMSSTGLISGIPEKGTAGFHSVHVTVADSAGQSDTVVRSLAIFSELTISSEPLPPALELEFYGPNSLSVAGGAGPYLWQLVGGILPPGVTLNSAGSLSGTPQAGSAGAYSFTVHVSDATGGSHTATLSLVVEAPVGTVPEITGPASLPVGVVAIPYGPVTFTAASGSGLGYVWSATGLPQGLVLSSSGVLSGEPLSGTDGSYTVQVTVTDSSGNTVSGSFPLWVAQYPVVKSGGNRPSAVVNVPYPGYRIGIEGGVPPYTFSIVSGLPSGMTLSPGGTLSGTPAPGSEGTYQIRFRFTDSLGNTATGTLEAFVVKAEPDLLEIVSPASLPDGFAGSEYGPVKFTATGGSGLAYIWSASGLPQGLFMTPGGVLTAAVGATNGQEGSYTVQVTVSDSTGHTASIPFSLRIFKGFWRTGPGPSWIAAVNVPYPNYVITLEGGVPPYTFSNVSGLPNGMSLSPQGVLSGTPAPGSEGTYPLVFQVTDSVGNLWTFDLDINGLVVDADPGPLAITGPAVLPPGWVAEPYGPLQFTASGGGDSPKWRTTGLPAGLIMSSAGSLGGTPGQWSTGSNAVRVTVHDSYGRSVTETFDLVIDLRKLEIGPSPLPAGTVGTTYGPVALTASGGTAPYTFTAMGGLPVGLNLSSAGVLSGFLDFGTAGTYGLNVRVSGSGGITTSATLTLTISPQTAEDLTLSCSPDAGPASAGESYSSTCSASGGTPSYHWSVFGLLPGGLSFDPATGAVTGTPAAPGAYNYTIKVTDSGQPAQSAVRAYRGTIRLPEFSVAPSSLSFSYSSGSAVPPRQLEISPDGLAFSVAVENGPGCSWLGVSPSSGTSPQTVPVSVDPGGLAPGSYSCGLTVSVGAGTRYVPVSLSVTGQSLAASPTSLSFAAPAGSGAPPSQTIRVFSPLEETVYFQASAGCDWVSIVQAGTATPSELTVSVEPSGLPPGTYTCPVILTAPGAVDIPRAVVTLRVNAASIEVAPETVALKAGLGSHTPIVASLSLTGPETPVQFSASVAAESGGNWLTLNTPAGSTPSTIQLYANPSGLAERAYSATVHIVSANGNVQVPVQLTIAAEMFRTVPPALTFRFREGETPAPEIVTVVAGEFPPSFTFQTAGKVSAHAGPGDASITVSPDAGLAAGTYTGNSITVFAAGTTGLSQTVPVAVIVDPPLPAPLLTVGPSGLTLLFAQGSLSATRLLVATNEGSAWTPAVGVSTSDGGNWLTISPLPSAAGDGEAVAISVTANPSKVSGAGTFGGEITVFNPATNQQVGVPVIMVINPLPSIALSRQGLGFTAVQAGSHVPPQTVDLRNLGLRPVNWTAVASTLSGGEWLTVAETSGACNGGSAAGIGVSIDTAAITGLAPGSYYGSIEVRAADGETGQEVANSPQSVVVVLNLLPSNSQLGPTVHPGALIFGGETGGAGVPVQAVSIYNPNLATVGYTAAAVTGDGSRWCSVSPTAGSVTGTMTLDVQAAVQDLPMGVHSCTIQLVFTDGTYQSVSVLGIVTAAGARSTAAQVSRRAAWSAGLNGCATADLVVALREPSQPFAVKAYQPVGLEVEVRDGCGVPVDDAAVSVNFSIAEEAVAAESVGGGIYRGSWTPVAVPRNVPRSDVRLRISAQALAGGEVMAKGSLPAVATVWLDEQTPTMIAPGGLVNSASFAADGRVAPCAWIAIFGERLAGGVALAGEAPLPSRLMGARVLLGGQTLPLLYASPGQLNAQVPCGVQPNTRQSLEVINGTARSQPVNVVVAAAKPAIFTLNQQGFGQAAVFWTSPDGNYAVADPANPVPEGGVVEIYCTGLGGASPAVAEGTISPADPLGWAVLPVSVKIGGESAKVLYSGLTPGAIGVYQINAVIPASVPVSGPVPVVISVDGQSSQPGVTAAIQ